MDKYKVIYTPHPTLKTKSPPIEHITDEIKAQARRMLNTMYEPDINGVGAIGLAANQVNILNRMLVTDFEQDERGQRKNPIVMINPEIVKASEKRSVMNEGCLSLPHQFAEVDRPADIVVSWLDVDGNRQEGAFTELGSHCIQHEIDHLDGIVFVDYLSRLRRNSFLRKVEKLKKQQII